MAEDDEGIELDLLVGPHVLDAVDMDFGELGPPQERIWSDPDCETISFRIDGVVYTIVEDPCDGYRSHMNDLIIVDDREMKNVFPPIRVEARKMAPSDNYEHDVLEFVDVVTGKIVIEVGTAYEDDYYPRFVGRFHPENMVTNAGVELGDE